MNSFVAFFTQITPVLQSILLIATIVGSVFVFKNTRKAGIVKMQSDTIVTMQQQIDVLKEQTIEQQKKIDRLEFEQQAMREALKDEGILITVDGEKVTIKDAREPNTTRHVIRKPTKKTTTTMVKKEEEGT